MRRTPTPLRISAFLIALIISAPTVAQYTATEYNDEAAFLADLAAQGYTTFAEDFEDPGWDHVRSNYPDTQAAPFVTNFGVTWTGNDLISTNTNWGRNETWGVFTIFTPPISTPDELDLNADQTLFAVGGWFYVNSTGDLAIEIDGQDVAVRAMVYGHHFLGVIVPCGFTSVRIHDQEQHSAWGADDFTFATGGPPYTDCNTNGVSDACDLLAGVDSDCNENGVPDSCDVDSGLDEDCNSNGILDSCEISAIAHYASPQLAPIHGLAAQSYTITDPTLANDIVTLTFEASSHLSGPTRYISITIDGAPLGDIYTDTGEDCPEPPNDPLDIDTILIDSTIWNAAANDGELVITMTATADVIDDECDLPYIFVTADVPRTADNDQNNNGVPDECEISLCPWDTAPAGGDYTVGLGDLNDLLSNWGSCPAPPAECPWDFAPEGGDQTVGLGDLNALLSNWGPCP